MKKTLSITFIIIAGLFTFFLEIVAAQSPLEHEISFEQLGYQDITETGPIARITYYFNLPASWDVVNDTFLSLDLELNTIRLKQETTPLLAIEVSLNDETLHTAQYSTIITEQLRIDIPVEHIRLNENERPNIIRVNLTEYSECGEILSIITVKNSSTLHFSYQPRAIPIDLARFPQPFYNRWAMEPNHVRFVMPDMPDEATVQAAAIIATRLGQLTAHSLPISVTFASQYQPLSPENQIIIGKLNNDKHIDQLNLPVSVQKRELVMYSQMPTAITPVSIFSYTIFVENSSTSTRTLTVEDRLSPNVKLLTCQSCDVVEPDKIRWNLGELAAGEKAEVNVTLQATPATTLTVPVIFKHTATLWDGAENILNEDTLSASITPAGDTVLQSSLSKKSDVFLTYQQQAIPSNAGILHEFVSPWSADNVALVVTGLDNEAILKAAQGLNPQNKFPGIWGDTAIIEDIKPAVATDTPSKQIITLASLGYDNSELNMIANEAREYFFYLPADQKIDRNSYFSLHYAHAPIDVDSYGMVKILLNNTPVAGVNLETNNTADASVSIPLNPLVTRAGRNKIRIQPVTNITGRCLQYQNNPYWFEIYADSFLYLKETPTRETNIALDYFPLPFNTPPDLTSLLFSLPSPPDPIDIEGALNLASLIGNSSQTKDFYPQVMLGEIGSRDVSNSHIIAVGLPSANPVINEANPRLPQPFILETDKIYQTVDKPIYNIPTDINLGFVQEIVSPWDPTKKHALLVVTGVNKTGLTQAMTTFSKFWYNFTGELASVRDAQIYNADPRPAVSRKTIELPTPMLSPDNTPEPEQSATPISEIQPTQTAETTPPPTPSPASTPTFSAVASETDQPANTQPTWLILLLVVSILVITISVVLSIRRVQL